jgi:leucyl/phenylalanyl-tRNA---protein transferase
MAENGTLGYFQCDPRSVLCFDSFHIPKRLLRRWKQNLFEYRLDTAFMDVVKHCREGRPEWISQELMQIYEVLHQMGLAHSFEAWQGDRLVGGVYGMSFGAAFLAESMFHLESHASNLCVVYMMNCLKQSHFEFCDIQYANEHTAIFEPEDWPLKSFMQKYQSALNKMVTLESHA